LNFKRIGFAFIALAVVCVLVAGLWGVSFTRTNQYTVQSTPSEAWNYLSNINYYPEWYDGFIRYDKIHGAFRHEGTQYYIYIEDEGQEYKIIETITDLDSPQLIGLEYQHDFYNLDIMLEISSDTDSTSTVTLSQKIYGTRFLENILLPLYAHQVMYEHAGHYKSAIEHLSK
jgi:hypothetical protein